MTILFRTNQNEFQLKNNPNKTIIELARDIGLLIKTSCGGKGKCGRCLVNLKKGKFRIENKEIVVSGNQHQALSCITKILSDDAVIEIPHNSLVESTCKIIDSFVLKHYENNPQTQKFYLEIPFATLENQTSDRHRIIDALYEKTSIKNIYIPFDVLQKVPDALMQGNQKITVTLGRIRDYWHMIRIEPGDKTLTNYAIAMDIGTTTIVGLMINLTNGKIVRRASLYNQQITVAEDVISRISYCKTQRKINHLNKLIVQDSIYPIIKQLCSESNEEPESINRMTVSGNTIMIHLLLGLNPRGIGHAPFQPVIRMPGAFQAKEIGIGIHKNGIVDFIPSVSGYIGGDIISDIYVSKLHKKGEFTVLIDIGTNGEIVMSDNGKMIACSTAAGPAFEGYGLYHGCRTSEGAIEKVFFDQDGSIHIKAIGSDKASGICGTGIIDFIAEGFRIGLISNSGRFNDGLLKNLKLYHTIEENGNIINACIIANPASSEIEGPIIVTQSDIVKIMQAKAAIYAGLRTLLHIQNKTWNDIKRLVLAGGFARHITIQNAIRIGLLPNIPEERIEIIGNGSLAGAFLALIEPNALENMKDISHQLEVIELNIHKEFQGYYIDALFLPDIKKENILSNSEGR